MDIRSYLKEYVRITLASIRIPTAFFTEIKGEGKQYLKPLAYILTTYAIYTAGQFIADEYLGTILIYFRLALFFKYVISAALFIVLMYLAVRLVGGKGSFNDTFKVVCYSESPLNFTWILYVSMLLAFKYLSYLGNFTIAMLYVILSAIANLYVFYIIVAGISVTSGITRLRAFAAVAIQFVVYIVPLILIILGMLYFLNIGYIKSFYNDITKQPEQEIEKYDITVYRGSTAVIDGIINDNDRWFEGTQVPIEAGGKRYSFTAKHDGENIYMLMEWEGTPEWKDQFAVYFEQDSRDPDRNLSSGRVDRYYQGDRDNPSLLADSHYDSGEYTSSENQDGSLKVGYTGEWIMEWKIPLNSGDKYDIYVDRYPAQLGFSIMNEAASPEGIFPPYANKSDPKTWGTMTIADRKIQ